jgi:hypothetical protein
MNKKKDCKAIKKKGRSDRKMQMGLWKLRKIIILPIIFDGSCTSSNIIDKNSKHLHEYVRQPNAWNLYRPVHTPGPNTTIFSSLLLSPQTNEHNKSTSTIQQEPRLFIYPSDIICDI